jgi:disulfide bond formation protein DsbB
MTSPDPALPFADKASPGPAEAGWALVFAAWLVATASTLGALFLSEVMGVAPCPLCWYQRVFMFPLVFVLACGLFPLDRRVLRYATPLVVVGWLVALFHLLLTRGYIPETMTPCSQGIPCSRIEVEWFGFVTIPLLSLLSFSAIGLALAAYHYKTRQ